MYIIFQMSQAPVYADLLKKALVDNSALPAMHVLRNGQYLTRTFGEVHLELNRLCSALKAKGFGKGKNGLIIGENTPEWVLAYHAVVLSGGCAVPVDPNLPEPEIIEIIRQAGPSVAFCSAAFFPFLSGLAKEGSLKAEILSLPCEGYGESGYDRLAASGDGKVEAFAARFSPDDPVAVIFTSGTTGRAKGALLVQRNFTAVTLSGIPRMKAGPGDVMLAVLPLHHVFGFAACAAASLCSGIAVVYLPVVKGPLIVEAMKDKGVTILPAVPQMLELFYASIERKVREKGKATALVFSLLKGVAPVLGPSARKKLFSSVHEGFGGRLRVIISGGASIRKRYFNGFRNMGFNIVEGYGLTETFGPITLCPLDDPRLASVGRVLEGNEMKVLNPDREGRGEVCFKGDTVFAGYYNNEEATRAAFDKEGWFHTGDLGRVTKDGFLYLTGRLKDIIVLPSGKNVYPDELEDFYAACPGVEEIGVFGIHTPEGETVAAVAVPSREIRNQFTREEARVRVARGVSEMGKSLPTYKKIADCEISFDPLPRTSTKKIRKNELREIYLALKDQGGTRAPRPAVFTVREQELMKGEAFTSLRAIAESLSRERVSGVITLRTRLEQDLGLDSLKRLEMLSRMEKAFNIPITDAAFSRLETVGDALALVSEGLPAFPPARKGRERLAIKPNSGLLYRAAPHVVLPVSRLCWGVRAEGLEEVPVADGPLIFAANHESMLDISWILCLLPWEVRRRTFTVGKAELSAFPGGARLLKGLNMVAVERGGDFQQAMELSLDILRKGFNLAIFPEGTRTRTGEMGRFRSGVGRLMIETNARVVPVRICGTFQIWPPDRAPRFFLARGHRPVISYGKALSIDDLRRAGVPAEPEAVAAYIRSVVAAM